MKKFALTLLIGAGLLLSGIHKMNSQDLSLGSIYEKENVPYRKPVPLPYLREADIPWSKMIWRMVDLREKINHPLYFPTTPFGPRMSLIDVLVRAAENGELTVYYDEQFNTPKDFKIVQNELGGEAQIIMVVDPDTGQQIAREIEGECVHLDEE